MGKGLAIFGLLLIIVGILPIIFPLIGLDAYIAYFSLEYYITGFSYSLFLGTYEFTELMLILIGVGALFLIIGAIK
ncbi:MAG: hypothetical protein RTV72_11325 [Candidatus Thorarchaeota archaeon]